MASKDPARPNVLLVISDDQGAWALGCGGNREIRTPVLDALAAKGIRFENFFCTSPVCSPARASLLTGDIPSRHGVHDWIRQGSMPPARIDRAIIQPVGLRLPGQRIQHLETARRRIEAVKAGLQAHKKNAQK